MSLIWTLAKVSFDAEEGTKGPAAANVKKIG